MPVVEANGVPFIDGLNYNPGASYMDPNALVWQRPAIHDGEIHGEKWMTQWTNDMQAYGENMEAMANTRYPYSSDNSRPPLVPVSNLGTASGFAV